MTDNRVYQWIYVAHFTLSTVVAIASMAMGNWLVWPALAMMFVAGVLVFHYGLEEQREKQNGTDRRADTEVHSDPDDGAFSITWEEHADGTTTVTTSGTAPTDIGTVSWPREQRSEPRAVERTGIRLGEVEGYRAWRLCGPFLLSVASGTVWMPGQPCEGTGLSENNHAGVHAWKSLQKAKEYAEDEAPAVVGKVKLWGEIVEHELGYRGEYAKPVELIAAVLSSDGSGESDELLAPIEPRVLAEVSRFYGLPNGAV